MVDADRLVRLRQKRAELTELLAEARQSVKACRAAIARAEDIRAQATRQRQHAVLRRCEPIAAAPTGAVLQHTEAAG